KVGANGNWRSDASLKNLLGGVVDWQHSSPSLGALSFQGPYVLHGTQPLFPAPLSLLGKPVVHEKSGGPAWERIVRLAPTNSTQRLSCDLTSHDGKSADLPQGMGDTAGAKELAGCWLGGAAM